MPTNITENQIREEVGYVEVSRDANGRVTQVATYTDETKTSLLSKSVVTRDGSGRVATKVYTLYDGGDNQVTTHTYARDANGRFSSETISVEGL